MRWWASSLLLLGCLDGDVQATGESLGVGSDEAEEPVRVGSIPTYPDLAPPLEPATPRAALQLLPDDMMTSVRGMAPTVLVSASLTAEDVEAVTRALNLVRWPARTPVEFRVEFEPADPSAGRAASSFLMVPTPALEPGWYAAVVDTATLPSHLRSGATGPLVHRFAPDRRTVVAHVAAESSDSGTRLTLRFSARLRDARSAESWIAIEQAGERQHCESESDELLRADEGTYEVVLRCDGVGLPFHVAIDPTVRSLDGVALGDAYGGPVDFGAEADPALLSTVAARAGAVSSSLHRPIPAAALSSSIRVASRT